MEVGAGARAEGLGVRVEVGEGVRAETILRPARYGGEPHYNEITG